MKMTDVPSRTSVRMIAIERLQDLDALLEPDREVLDLRVGVEREARRLRELAHPRPPGVVVEERAPRRLGAEDDVLGHRHHRDQHEVLVDHPDPALDRVLRRAHPHGLALDQDLALVRVVEPVEDVHQGRLARAVLAEERVHLVREQVEVDPVVRDDAREALRDTAQLQDGGVGHLGDSCRKAGRHRPPSCVGHGS
jgi:hypothetical protein